MSRKSAMENIPLTTFLHRLSAGDFDEDLPRIQIAIDERQEEFKAKLRRLVKEVFGPHAIIVDERLREPETEESKSNPFVERKRPPIPLDKESSEENLDKLEQRLNEGDKPPIESRGAIIGGISSSDIGD